MRKHKRGFTLIEVVLFLGLTAALFAGIAAGVGNSVYQQRYSDAVQNFAEFLRSVYAQVVNTQSENNGRTDQAIYGKVITFRAQEVNGGKTTGNVIKTYNLIGDLESIQLNGQVGSGFNNGTGEVTCDGNHTVIPRLKCLQANVLTEKEEGNNWGNNFKAVGYVEQYRPRWGSEIQTVGGWNNGTGYDVFEAIVLIVRSPSSGNISTYVWSPYTVGSNGAVSVNEDWRNKIRKVIDQIDFCTGERPGTCANNGDVFGTRNGATYESYMDPNYFKPQELDFCLNPAGSQLSSIRRDIRVVRAAHNASGINILDEDKVTNDPAGTVVDPKMEHNRCR